MAEMRMVIFDKDGTLLDSNYDTIEAHSRVLSPIASREETTKLIGGTLGYTTDRQYALIRLAKERGLEIDDVISNEIMYTAEIESLRNDRTTLQLLDDFWEYVRYIPAPPFPETTEALQLLKNAQFFLGISTGYRSDIVVAQLEAAKLLKYFCRDLIFGHDPPIVKGDPHITELKRRRELTDEQLKQVYMIGDGVGEMGTAKKYGMIGYGIDRTCNESQLRNAGAIMVFPNLIECSRYILGRSK